MITAFASQPALQALRPLASTHNQPRPGFARPLPLLPVFGSDRLALTSLRAQDPDPNVIQNFTIERAKLDHVAPDLAQLPDFKVTPLRIGIETDQMQARFSLRQATLYVEGPEGRVPLLDDANGDFEAEAIPGGFALKHQGQSLGRHIGRLVVEHQAPTMVVNGQIFRGQLELMPSPTNPARFHVINPVMIEDYLLSVVPSESPASWPLESLKAQAMAARTYAVANWGKHKANGFDMKDDTSDQMYRGVVTEAPGSSEAVKATAHQIITHGGKPINALFFSCSGGMTDSSLEVWGVDLPYIQPAQDFDQASPRYRWSATKSQQDLQQAAQKLGVSVGQIKEIQPLSFTPQGRVKTLRLVGNLGSADVDGNKFRFAAGLNSTLWQAVPGGSGANRQFTFNGGGWGHGLGMSQYGARQMAADGQSAEAILKHFYQGVEFQSL
ncbi:MAG: hypothetical protein CVV27_18765 [Candidatus Melainabacteria bacterium HGW-Melainabacteria-1]|nr:MAG: hypothetical protein CVV27_18765 [Candidatus Melainabacteria bacterium HGW-Melainabacteria-1]